MKKISIFAIIAIFLMMPLASLAKKSMPDVELDAVTAQVGVTTDFVNVRVSSVVVDYASFGDGDGWGTAGGNTMNTSAGYIGVNGVTITGDVVAINGIMIQDTGSTGGVTKTRTIMPTIYIGGMPSGAGMNITANLRLSGSRDLSGAGTNCTLGVINISGLKAQITGTTYMYAH